MSSPCVTKDTALAVGRLTFCRYESIFALFSRFTKFSPCVSSPIAPEKQVTLVDPMFRFYFRKTCRLDLPESHWNILTVFNAQPPNSTLTLKYWLMSGETEKKDKSWALSSPLLLNFVEQFSVSLVCIDTCVRLKTPLFDVTLAHIDTNIDDWISKSFSAWFQMFGNLRLNLSSSWATVVLLILDRVKLVT